MKVLVINPGATSTKVAVFEEEQELLKKSIVHTAQELEGFDRVIDQAELRQRAVLEAVAEGKISPSRHRSYVRLYELAKENKPWEKN